MYYHCVSITFKQFGTHACTGRYVQRGLGSMRASNVTSKSFRHPCVLQCCFAQTHESNEPIKFSLCAALVLCNEGFIFLCVGSVIQVVTEILELCIEIEFEITRWSTIERRLLIPFVVGLVISNALALIDHWGCLRSCHASLELLLTSSMMI